MSNDFNCEQLEPLLSAYHDGELTEAERASADRHLKECTVCQNRLVEISAVASSLRSLPRLNPKLDVAANIEQLIAKKPRNVANRQPLVWGAAGIAAAVAAIVVGMNMQNAVNPGNATLTANSKSTQRTLKESSQQPMEVAKGVEPEVASGVGETDQPDQQLELATKDSSKRENSNTSDSSSRKDSQSGESTGKPAVDHNSKRNGKFNPHLEVADKTPTASPAGGNTTSGSHLDGSDRLIASSNSGAGVVGADANLVAVFDTEQRGVTEELGITTDEDGLYAIKL